MTLTQTTTRKARPFLKWVGGKTHLLKKISEILPHDLSSRQNLTYVEPFVGGGAVLFWILQAYPSVFQHAVIADTNQKLLDTYECVKNNVEGLILHLYSLQEEYYHSSEKERNRYYSFYKTRFNSEDLGKVETAAIFIFLNKTCFSGIYRVDSKGNFNTPHGGFAKPLICDPDNLRACSKILQKVEILRGDFSITENIGGANTLYYLDPPYKRISKTPAPVLYSENRFCDDDQIRLRDFCNRISKKGSMFIASNSDTSEDENDMFDSLYLSFFIQKIPVRRNLGRNGSRKIVSEIIIHN